jgi:plasmid stabilization system protein ParE
VAKVIWSPSALDDVDRLAEYIARDAPARAALFATRLLQATDALEAFPLCGRPIPEIGDPSCREILHGAYRVMYRVRGDQVWITGVVHGARNWRPDAQKAEDSAAD